MGNLHRQRGITFISLVVVLAIAGTFIVIGLKVAPMYIESFQVETALENIIKESNVESMSRGEIYDKFLRHMEINEIRRFSKRELPQLLKVNREKGRVVLTMDYQSERHLFSNLYIRAEWHKEVSS